MCFWPDTAMTATTGPPRSVSTIRPLSPFDSASHSPPAVTKWL